MRKLLELAVQLAAILVIGNQINNENLNEGELFKDINNGFEELGIEQVDFEQAQNEIETYVENDDADGLLGYIDTLFKDSFQNPMDNLLNNFDF